MSFYDTIDVNVKLPGSQTSTRITLGSDQCVADALQAIAREQHLTFAPNAFTLLCSPSESSPGVIFDMNSDAPLKTLVNSKVRLFYLITTERYN